MRVGNLLQHFNDHKLLSRDVMLHHTAATCMALPAALCNAAVERCSAVCVLQHAKCRLQNVHMACTCDMWCQQLALLETLALLELADG